MLHKMKKSMALFIFGCFLSALFCGPAIAQQTIPLPEDDDGGDVTYVKIDDDTIRVTVEEYVQTLTATECVPEAVPYTELVPGSSVDYQRSELENDIAEINAELSRLSTVVDVEVNKHTAIEETLSKEVAASIAENERKRAIKQEILDNMDAK
jgi:hypothetical protein